MAKILSEYPTVSFKTGLFTQFEEQSIPEGSASSSNNWVTLLDHIELRGGQTIMGSNISSSGNISGLIVAKRFDGFNVPFASYDRKVLTYDISSDVWNESSTPDILPVAASGEDINFDVYSSLAGDMVYFSSKNSSIYKVPVANPTDVIDQVSTTFRGRIKISEGSMYLWDNKNSVGGVDTTGLRRSKLDRDQLTDYTTVTAEAIGASGSTTYSGTLAFKAGNAKNTCMNVSFSGNTGAGVETFTDSSIGTLTGNLGGTGTINYATGAYSVTFNGVTTGSVTADYYHENATSNGILDFALSTPRVAGEGFSVRQDGGGAELQSVAIFGDSVYCLHTYKTWKFSVDSTDTTATNKIYREAVGIPNHRAFCTTAEGIYHIDARDANNPNFALLAYSELNTELQPKVISNNLNLKGYVFDQSVVYEWEDYILFACKSSGSTINDTTFLYNRRLKNWDKIDVRVSQFGTYNGVLIAGDSGSKNVFQVFSGLTDDDIEIANHWVSNKTMVGMEGTKYFNRFEIEGLIDPDQELEIYFSYDQGEFVLVETISGQGSYVDSSQSVTIGSATCGSQEIGGGSDGVTARRYHREFRVNTPIFEKIRYKFVATKVGYVSVTKYNPKDIRQKSKHIGAQYVTS